MSETRRDATVVHKPAEELARLCRERLAQLNARHQQLREAWLVLTANKPDDTDSSPAADAWRARGEALTSSMEDVMRPTMRARELLSRAEAADGDVAVSAEDVRLLAEPVPS